MKTLYSPSDVAEQLGIQSSTLRKYADVLEKEGYTFIKNERGHRKYRESGVMVFRKIINLKNDTDSTTYRLASGTRKGNQSSYVRHINSFAIAWSYWANNVCTIIC